MAHEYRNSQTVPRPTNFMSISHRHFWCMGHLSSFAKVSACSVLSFSPFVPLLTSLSFFLSLKVHTPSLLTMLYFTICCGCNIHDARLPFEIAKHSRNENILNIYNSLQRTLSEKMSLRSVNGSTVFKSESTVIYNVLEANLLIA